MTRRSRARDVALQMLFQFDFNAKVDRAVQEQFVRERLHDPALEPFCWKLFEGVQGQRSAIDKHLAEAAENWRLQRMAGVDRNVLRLGAYELLFEPDVPTSSAIDEAIELARRYGSKDSPGFVNGVLDRIARMRTPTPAPADTGDAGEPQ